MQDNPLPYNIYPESLSSWKERKKPLWHLGTRTPSKQGVLNAKEITKISVDKGFCIVSGMAKGIDAIAHSQALDSKGHTIAVMGTSIEACYPKENLDLKKRIMKSGLVLSQFKRGERPKKHNFPKRNELMAELSFASVVVEAGSISGVRYQIEKAFQLRKEIVFLKPGIDLKYKWVSKYLNYNN